MDSNILLAIVIVAACIAAFFYLKKHKADLIAKVETAAAGVQSHVSGVVTNAQSDLNRTITTAVIPPRTLSPGVASSTANVATAPNPPAPTLAAADAGNVTSATAAKVDPAAQNGAGSTQAAPAASAPAATLASAPAADLGGAPPTEANLTAYGFKNIAIAGEVPGFVSYGLNMQPPASSVLQAFMTWSAAIAARASNLASVQGFQPGGDAFNVSGKDYSAVAIMAKFNALDPYQQSAALSTDNIVANAVSVSMGRSVAWANFCSDRMAAGRGIYYMGPGSFDNASGVLRWYDVNGGAQVANVGAFY